MAEGDNDKPGEGAEGKKDGVKGDRAKREMPEGPAHLSKDDWIVKYLGVDLPKPKAPATEGDTDTDTDTDTDIPPPGTLEGLDLPGGTPKDGLQVKATDTLRDGLIKIHQTEFAVLPAGARTVRVDGLTTLRNQFPTASTSGDGPTQVKALSALNRSLRSAFADVEKEIRTLIELRAGLLETLTKVAPTAPVGDLELVADATAKDQATAQTTHRQLLLDMADREAAPDALNLLYTTIAQLETEIEAVGQVVSQRQERRQKVIDDALEVRLHPKAPADALDKQRADVTEPLKAQPLDDTDVETAQKALDALRLAANTLNEKTGRVVAKRDEYDKQLDTTVASLKGGGLLSEEAIESGRLACEKLLGDIQAEGEIDKFPTQLATFRGSVKAAALTAMNKDRPAGKAALCKALNKELDALALEAKALETNPNADPALIKNLPLLSTARKALDPDKRGGTIDAQVQDYLTALETYRRGVQAVRLSTSEKTALIAVDRDVLKSRVGKPDPTGAASEFTERLGTLRAQVKDLLKDPLTKSSVDSARSKTLEFERLLVVTDKDIVDAAEVQASSERVTKLYDGIHGGARKAVKLELTAALDAARQMAGRSGKARNMDAARKLYAALELRLQAVKNEADGADAAKVTYLQGVQIDGKPIDPKTLEDAYDLLGPAALKDLQQDKGGAKNIVTVCEALKAGGAVVQQFYDEALGGNAKAFASLLRNGDGAQLKGLADAFQDTGDRKRFGELVKNGGLGESPECLADLLNFGVASAEPEDRAGTRDGNIARLKQLGTAFGDKGGPAALKGILVDGGLGARPTKDKPGVMAELLQSGGAPKLREFANAYVGTDGEAVTNRKNLKTLVDKGGFGDHPTTLAPLIKDAGVDCVKNIGSQFAAPTDAAKLRKLLSAGGMSGDTDEQAHKHEHPDTLAKVVVDGFKGSASNLKKFATAFDGEPGQCKEMLDAWNMYPKGKAAHRQPGKQIAKLLGKDHLMGDVQKLQTTFTTNMQRVPAGKRERALRMAPNFDSEAGPGSNAKPPVMVTKGLGEVVVSYIAERHTPKHAQKSRLDAQNSYFPANTDASKLTAIIAEAMGQPNAPGLGQTRTVVCPTAGLTVEIAVNPAGNIVHCFPTRGATPPDPNEIANFTSAESTAIFDAVK